MDLVSPARIPGDEVATELMHDGDPDPGGQRDLVSDTDAAQRRWQFLLGPDLCEKARVQSTEALGGLNGAKLHVVNCHTGGTVSDRVGHEQDPALKGGLVDVEDLLDQLVDLLAGSVGPLTSAAGETGQSCYSDPVLFRPVQHPIIKLGMSSLLQIMIGGQEAMTVFQVRQAIVMVPNGLLNCGDLDLRIHRFQIKD